MTIAKITPKITPCLWVDTDVEAMLAFYRQIDPTLTVDELSHWEDGRVLVATVTMLGQRVMLLNGGPHYTLTPAISLYVSCNDQAEVDYYWDHLLNGGEPSQCGWLTDRFGVSWQIVPKQLPELLSDPDRQRANRVMQAMLQMVKLDVAQLQAAADL